MLLFGSLGIGSGDQLALIMSMSWDVKNSHEAESGMDVCFVSLFRLICRVVVKDHPGGSDGAK